MREESVVNRGSLVSHLAVCLRNARIFKCCDCLAEKFSGILFCDHEHKLLVERVEVMAIGHLSR